MTVPNPQGGGGDLALPAAASLDGISATRGTVLYRGSAAWAGLAPSTAGNLLRTGGAGADPSYVSPSGVLDTFGTTRGALPLRGASAWGLLTPGTIGKVLTANGAGADPTWETPSGGGGGGDSMWEEDALLGAAVLSDPTLAVVIGNTSDIGSGDEVLRVIGISAKPEIVLKGYSVEVEDPDSEDGLGAVTIEAGRVANAAADIIAQGASLVLYEAYADSGDLSSGGFNLDGGDAYDAADGARGEYAGTVNIGSGDTRFAGGALIQMYGSNTGANANPGVDDEYGQGGKFEATAGGADSNNASGGRLTLNEGQAFDGEHHAGDAELVAGNGATAVGSLKLGASYNKLAFFGATSVPRQTNIADPSGGGTQDAEARSAIVSILNLIEAYGLMEALS